MEILCVQTFYKDLEKILSSEQISQVTTVISDMNVHRGKVLGPQYFKEIKFGSKRVYFIYKNQQVLFIGVSNKKNQQGVIDILRKDMDAFLQLLD